MHVVCEDSTCVGSNVLVLVCVHKNRHISDVEQVEQTIGVKLGVMLVL